jgi:predicted MFS family arabinose efflux permease
LTLGMGTGAACGAWIGGWLRDATGGYGAGFLFAVTALLLGLIQFWVIPALARGRHPPGLQAPR